MVDCQHVMRRLWEYLDGELPEHEVAELREHVAVCARCNPQYRFQIAFLGLVGRAAAAGRARPELGRRIRSALATIQP
jgi:mycothiol system anti-sigma-R factor